MDSYDLNGLTRNLRFQTGSHYDFEAGFEGFELGGTNGPGSGKAVLQAGTRVIISGRNQQKLHAVKACTRN